MAISAIAGLATAAGAVVTAGGLAGLTLFGLGTAGSLAAAFAIGAGLSAVSRALMPKPSFDQMRGLNFNVRDPQSPKKMIYGRSRIGGTIIAIGSSGTDNKYLTMVIAIAGHRIEEFEEIYFNDEKIWDSGYQGDWGNYVEHEFLVGYDADQSSTLADNGIAGWVSSGALKRHTLNGVAALVVRLEYDAEVFTSGVPNISVVVRGSRAYDPRQDSTSSYYDSSVGDSYHRPTGSWSDEGYTINPAIILLDYLTNEKYGLGESIDNIDLQSVADAADICDEDVALDAGGTQKRFTCDGVLDTANTHKANIENILSSMIGTLTLVGGKYVMTAHAYQTPSLDINEDNLIAPLEVTTKQSRRNIYNAVKGSFVSEEENYVVADYPSQVSSSYATADGETIYLDMALPMTTNNIRAQRIARLTMLKSRLQTTVKMRLNLTGLKVKVGDNIRLSNTRLGYTNKIFEIINYNLVLDQENGLAVEIEAIENDSAAYTWNTSDELDFTVGGTVTLYDGKTVAAPTSFAGTASAATNLDGTTVSQIVSTWTASADAFVVKYEYQWSTDNSTWNSIDVQGTQFTISPTVGAATYYTRVRAVNDLGVHSAFVTDNVTALGDTTAPALPTSISASGGQGSITLSWTNPTDKDFSNVEIHRSTTEGGTYTAVASVAGGYGLPSSFVNGSLNDSTAYYYKLKSVDYSGNKSEFTSVVNATTNAPASPPRADNGYVYYTVSSASAPSTPSATSYNYNTAAFGGLSTNWQKNPPTINGADGKFWASSFTITEATFGGAQTITFSAPFASTQFDGLVTFTNLNTELANASSTEITTINGGLVTTGTIEADRVRIDGVGIDVVTNGTQKSLVIGDAGVTTVKIDDLAVTEGKIANLAVDTLKIADAAVFVEETASLASGFGISPADGWTTVVSKSIVLSNLSASSAVIINGIVQATNMSAVGKFFNYRIRRGSTVLKQFEAFIMADYVLNETSVIPLLYVDTPGNGTFTYEIQARDPVGTSSTDSMWVDLGIISIGAAKR